LPNSTDSFSALWRGFFSTLQNIAAAISTLYMIANFFCQTVPHLVLPYERVPI
jgi:hypothetical protein